MLAVDMSCNLIRITVLKTQTFPWLISWTENFYFQIMKNLLPTIFVIIICFIFLILLNFAINNFHCLKMKKEIFKTKLQYDTNNQEVMFFKTHLKNMICK